MVSILLMNIYQKLILLIFLLLIIGCAPQLKKEHIKVGVISPLTGDFSSYGTDVQRGINLALEEEGFDDVEVIYEDACLPKEASTAINKLVSFDEVDLISGVFCIISVEPILTITDPRDINVMMVASVPDSFVGISENLFSSHFAIRDEAVEQAEFAYETLGARKASILYLNNPFGVSYEKNFAERFEELGGSIVSREALDVYKGDFRTPLLKVRTAEPDVALIIHLGTELGLILKQAKDIGLEFPFIGTYEAEDVSVIETGGEAAEDLWISASSIEDRPATINFRERFVKEYGEPPSVISQNAYDAIKLQIGAFKQCSGDKLCIRNTLKDTKDYEGASGQFSISSEGTATKKIIFKQVQNGEFTVIQS